MTQLIAPGSGILFMKVGTHAREGLAEIIMRKSLEIEETGFAMWGYGGNTCHPLTMVQPFAEMFAGQGKPIHLVMEEMDSHHYAEQLRADEYSPNGLDWSEVPATVNVLGSRFALVIKRLRREEFTLPLDQTKVSVGPKTGRIGSRYIRGRVDKACLEILERPELTNETDVREVKINLVAELAEPYAVFLRNHR